MELRSYWHLLRRGWLLIAASLLVCLAAGVTLTFLADPQYESKAKLFVSNVEEDPTRAYRGGLFASLRVTSYADLVTSEALSDRVARQLNLRPGEDGFDPDDVTAEVLEGTVIIEITAVAPTSERARQIAQAYADQLPRLVDELETTPGSDAAPLKATVINDATSPEGPVSPAPARNISLALSLGLLLGAGLVIARDLFDSTVRTAQQATEISSAPLLGALPRIKEPTTILTTEAPDSALAEAFRVLRTNVDFLARPEAAPVYLVSSPAKVPSRRSTSINLALALAEVDADVLLVDGDLRQPQVDQLLGLGDGPGLSSVLAGEMDLDAALQQVDGSRLSVLTAGKPPTNPSELLGSDAMRALLEQLRKRFSTVIVDGPPLLPLTDASLLGPAVDGGLLVVEWGVTTVEQLRAATARLQTVGAHTAGVVLTQVPPNQPDFDFGSHVLRA